MSSMRSVGGHVLTALVTLALVTAWIGARDIRRRAEATAEVARAQAASRPIDPAPVPPPTPIPDDVLKAADVDEQINIRVYANANRSVVNITTAATSAAGRWCSMCCSKHAQVFGSLSARMRSRAKASTR